ncbi:MAG: hypothetical protein VX144_02225 [Candidatus Neomarinimicrobiota bacterium]|nr:hypothetical protein [Candidatus Neomarinimicrobiota bacterium]
MNSLRTLMQRYPIITSAIIFPFVFVLTYSMLALFIDIFLPIIISIWITGIVYNILAQGPGSGVKNNIYWTTRHYK